MVLKAFDYIADLSHAFEHRFLFSLLDIRFC